MPAPAAEGERGGFTDRELEIGRLILAGLTYKQIGQRLFLSAKTVEHHVARMRQRTGAGSRDELFGLLRGALEVEQAG
jgi:DNA-binding CsgD family transcriptional regulator